MATATTKQLSQKLGSIAQSWIKDPFRPNLQLQTFLKSLSTHPRLTPQAVDAACALRDNQLQKKVTSFALFLSIPGLNLLLLLSLVPLVKKNTAACLCSTSL